MAAVRVRCSLLLVLITTFLIASIYRLQYPVSSEIDGYLGYIYDSCGPSHQTATSSAIHKPSVPTTTVSSEAITTSSSTPTPTSKFPRVEQGSEYSHEDRDQETYHPGEDQKPFQDAVFQLKIQEYTKAILDPSDTTVPRMFCPELNTTRYEHLQVAKDDEPHLNYFIALDLRKCVDLLPRLLGSVVEAIRFLGTQHTVLSIVESNSENDGTRQVLLMLEGALKLVDIKYYYRSSDDIDPSGTDRIGKLAKLRSLALEPLRNSVNETARAADLPGSDLNFSADSTTVIFINDVAICTEDILELAHQRVLQGADMTCAMDWSHVGGPQAPALFYDVWISRALSGNLFFDIPDDGSWNKADHLFPFDPIAEIRFANHRPFQVFACWNGAVTFTAKPVLEGKIDFRSPGPGECFQGEPQLFCKDMWLQGYGKIAVVPSVNLEYTDEKGRRTKDDLGFASNWTAIEDEEDQHMAIDWEGPPDQVKCMPSFKQQSWRAWNESLV